MTERLQDGHFCVSAYCIPTDQKQILKDVIGEQPSVVDANGFHSRCK